jgi:hypothetical protein
MSSVARPSSSQPSDSVEGRQTTLNIFVLSHAEDSESSLVGFANPFDGMLVVN